jgi:cytochrome c oxidase subunit 4
MTDPGVAHHHPNYIAVWYWLIGLALGSVLVSTLPLPHTWITVIIFAVALVKAVLVALYFMHLKFERRLIYCLVFSPLLLFAILLLVLFPDIAMQ